MKTLLEKYLPVFENENENGAPETPYDPPKEQEPASEPENKNEDKSENKNEPEPNKQEEKESEEKSELTTLTADDIKLPEGFEVDTEAVGKFVELWNSDQSPAEKANAMIEMQTEMLSKAAEAQAAASMQQFEEMQTKWQEELRADKTFGPDFEKAVGDVETFLEPYRDEGFNDAMVLTGAGNHPAVVRTLYKLAKAFGEESPAEGVKNPNEGKRAEDVLFGSTK